MDLVDLMVEKRFLGQEFLTWLWWKSEERGGSIALQGEGEVVVSFEKHMLLESGEGESSEKLICTGLQTELQEARTGLQVGKKLEQARIVLSHNNYEYNLTITGGLMEFRNVRLPKTEATENEADENREAVEGAILERIFLFENLIRIVNLLFAVFVKVRISQDWLVQHKSINTWINQKAIITN